MDIVGQLVGQFAVGHMDCIGQSGSRDIETVGQFGMHKCTWQRHFEYLLTIFEKIAKKSIFHSPKGIFRGNLKC